MSTEPPPNFFPDPILKRAFNLIGANADEFCRVEQIVKCQKSITQDDRAECEKTLRKCQEFARALELWNLTS